MGPGVEPDVAVTSVEDAQRLQRELKKLQSGLGDTPGGEAECQVFSWQPGGRGVYSPLGVGELARGVLLRVFGFC